MSTTNINVRVDTGLKKDAESLFKDLGLSMTSAVTMFLRSAVNNDGIPFEIKRIPNKETKAALAEFEDMKDHNLYKRYDSFSDALNEVFDNA